jgi:hypothetical protein
MNENGYFQVGSAARKEPTDRPRANTVLLEKHSNGPRAVKKGGSKEGGRQQKLHKKTEDKKAGAENRHLQERFQGQRWTRPGSQRCLLGKTLIVELEKSSTKKTLQVSADAPSARG